ncbi:hypothetical protein ASPWEDRAFT_35421 [Aspergillus wentii DTO 134E9]|uniref:Uncharacterized protein n=1 Tax=Aspergillus wentii DTO 134E9 TaxID=1073089 RepID=A0A1L9S3R7_ASPWE|nr:uncharacterized protein ASPWEDRAFT_35421 [Aspergillus wentii DTO 134E9]OJJ41806.1 hypothetical protein ASPWEDRAFT_35421 [Aspergillus wentii DTO 134E9]
MPMPKPKIPRTIPTGHKNPFSEPTPDEHILFLPANPSSTPTPAQPPSTSPDSMRQRERERGSPPKPMIRRRQSWGEKDRRAEMRARLLAGEREVGRELEFVDVFLGR